MKKLIIAGFAFVVVLFLFVLTVRTSQGIVVQTGLNVVDVVAKDIKDPMLGLAFHLEYPLGWKYVDYEVGDYFKLDGQEPVVLVSDTGGKLIIGISLKRGDKLPVGAGDIMRFNFEQHGDLTDVRVTNTNVREVVNGDVREVDVGWECLCN